MIGVFLFQMNALGICLSILEILLSHKIINNEIYRLPGTLKVIIEAVPEFCITFDPTDVN